MIEDIKCCRIDIDDDKLQMAKAILYTEKELIEYKAKIFSLLGNAVRFKIILLFLEYKKMCVCDLTDVLEMKQSPISQHLRKLKDAGVLENEREGMTIFYSIPLSMKPELQKLIKG